MRKILLFILKVYKNLVSPFIHRLFGLSGMVCRHSPTCSVYAYKMIEEKGVFKGSYLGVKRLLGCHPWNDMLKLKSQRLKTQLKTAYFRNGSF